MYLSEKNIYLPTPNDYDLTTMQHLLSDTLDISFLNHAQDTTDVLLVLAYLAQYIAPEELSYIFGKRMGDKKIKWYITRLCNRKLLKAERFTHPDGAAKSAYCLTAHGINTVSSFLPPTLLQPVKIRRSGGYVPGHDYGTGMSLLSILSMGKPFNYRREYTIGGIYKKRRSLCIDALINIGHDILYLEQDMGVEPTRTLLNKIAAYSEQGLCGSNSGQLIFSCRRAEVPVNDKCFSLTNLEEIKSVAKNGVIECLDKLSEKGRICAQSLLTIMGVYNHKGARIGNRDVSYAELCRFINELNDGRNLYRMMLKGKLQVQAAFTTYMSMLRAFIPLITRSDRVEVLAILNGFSCSIYPTDLLSSFLIPVSMHEYMEPLYAGLKDTPEVIDVGPYHHFTCYPYDGGFCACGDLSHDLTFLLQYINAKRYYSGLSLFGCVDNYEQAKALSFIIPEAAFILRSGSRPFKIEKKENGTFRCAPVEEYNTVPFSVYNI